MEHKNKIIRNLTGYFLAPFYFERRSFHRQKRNALDEIQPFSRKNTSTRKNAEKPGKKKQN